MNSNPGPCCSLWHVGHLLNQVSRNVPKWNSTGDSTRIKIQDWEEKGFISLILSIFLTTQEFLFYLTFTPVVQYLELSPYRLGFKFRVSGCAFPCSSCICGPQVRALQP